MLDVKHFRSCGIRPRDSHRARDEVPSRRAWLAASVLLTLVATVARADDAPTLAIVVHGGAGVINKADMTPEREASYRIGLEAARDAGYAVLERGGTSLDAVTAAVRSLEDNPYFNAGRGAVLNHDGFAELDASIMDGKTLAAGAVTGIKHVKNPIELARAVMEKSPHVMLMGAGAEEFALEQGMTLVPNSYFRTDERVRQLERALKDEKAQRTSGASNSGRAGRTDAEYLAARTEATDERRFAERPPRARVDTAEAIGAQDIVGTRGAAGQLQRLANGASGTQEPAPIGASGTVGAVALDRFGNLAAATSTGGLTAKRAGRIGDSPIIGAGTYADNRSCAVSSTGDGELFIRAVAAHDVCALMAYKNLSLQAAAHTVIHEKIAALNATGGVIALDQAGDIAMEFNSDGMFRASRDSRGRKDFAIFQDRR
jgi:beta-aspartyl-peptidase (threonine type)